MKHTLALLFATLLGLGGLTPTTAEARTAVVIEVGHSHSSHAHYYHHSRRTYVRGHYVWHHHHRSYIPGHYVYLG